MLKSLDLASVIQASNHWSKQKIRKCCEASLSCALKATLTYVLTCGFIRMCYVMVKLAEVFGQQNGQLSVVKRSTACTEVTFKPAVFCGSMLRICMNKWTWCDSPDAPLESFKSYRIFIVKVHWNKLSKRQTFSQ